MDEPPSLIQPRAWNRETAAAYVPATGAPSGALAAAGARPSRVFYLRGRRAPFEKPMSPGEVGPLGPRAS